MREACVRSAQFQAAALQTEVDYKLDSQHKPSKYPVTFTDTDLDSSNTEPRICWAEATDRMVREVAASDPLQH